LEKNVTATISRLYDNYADATRAVSDLEAAGVPHDDISIVSNNSDNWYSGSTPASGRTTTANTTTTTNKIDRDGDGVDDRAEGAATGGSIGAGLGGAAGVLAGLGLLAIPGVGPVVAAGWLASLLTGAVAGGAVGGVIGALSQAGISKDDAPVYAEGLRRGGTLVSARVSDASQASLQAVMDRSAVNVGERRTAYQKSGWQTFDQNMTPYNAEQVRKEREMYGTRR
jgi:hypothetical protein